MIERGRLDELAPLEEWFHSRGQRLEFELTRMGWIAVVLPSDGPLGDEPLTSAEGSDPVAAARRARDRVMRLTV